MRFLTAALGLVLIVPSVQAQIPREDLARCARIAATGLRLRCYDILAKQQDDTLSANEPGGTLAATKREEDTTTRSAVPVPEGASMLDNWIMSVEVDPITDQKGVTFMLPAQGADRIDTPALSIRCKRGDLEAFVFPDEYLGSDNDRVTLRFGTEAPVEQRWSESGNHSALFVPGSRSKVEEFIRRLGRYDRLAIQVTPYSRGPVAMVFDLAGIARVHQELWTICPPKSN